MKKIIIALLVSIVSINCSGDDTTLAPTPSYEFENQSFVLLHFQTEQDCIDAQPNPGFFINCHKQIDFIENKQVNIVLTDILYSGTYSLKNGMLILNFKDNSEIPQNEITFEIITSSQIKNVDDNTIWNKMKGNSIWN